MSVIDLLKEILYVFVDMSPYILLGLAFVGVLHIYFKKDLVARHIGRNNLASVVKSSLFGIPLPLCSCGVVPTSVYMARNGASKGSVVSFLISTPQTGVDSIIATYGLMGWIFAIFRPFAALFMGVIGGGVIRYMYPQQNQDREFVEKMSESGDSCDDDCGDDCNDDCGDDGSCETEVKPAPRTAGQKLKEMSRYAFVEFLDDISVQFIVGVVISGLIAYFIPAGFFADSPVNSGLLGMLMMIVVGIPMYICATASIPIAVALMMKGFSPGVAFVFLAVGPATNAASLTIITKALGKKITVMYVAMITITAIMFGYLLDWVFSVTGADPVLQITHGHGAMIMTEEIKWTLASIFFILLAMSVYRKYIGNKPKEKIMEDDKKVNIEIEGMSCNHCVMNVQKSISGVEGVEHVEVSLANNSAYVRGDFDRSKVEKAVENVGYSVVN